MTKSTQIPGNRAKWSRREKALIYQHDGTVGELTASKSTSALICYVLERMPAHDGKSLLECLKERGYDLTTFRLSVRLAPKKQECADTQQQPFGERLRIAREEVAHEGH